MAESQAREIQADDLEQEWNTIPLEFSTTDELSPLDEIVGQPRAVHALELGLGITAPGYNIYVSGLEGMGRKSMILHAITRQAAKQPRADDWVYVNNFDHPDSPLAISIPAGRGTELQHDMEILVASLRDELPRAFRMEDFTREKRKINHKYDHQGKDILQELERMAAEKNLIVQQTTDGKILMIPKKDNRGITSEEFEQLPDEEKRRIAAAEQELADTVGAALSRQREINSRMRSDVRQAERDFAGRLINPLFEQISAKYTNPKLDSYLAAAQRNVLENLSRFQERDHGSGAGLHVQAALHDDQFIEYQVNVVVDNSPTPGAPIVVDDTPNYKHLFGSIHGAWDRMGRWITNFTHIKAGSLLRANGGYLVFDLREALLEPLVWKELKRTIQNGSLEYHMYDPFGVFATSSLKPEPIPLRLKLVVHGTPLLYYLLEIYEDDFPEIFKIKADFATEIDRQSDSASILARFIRKLSMKENLLPFRSDAIVELMRAGARMADDRNKLSARFGKIADLARESGFWAQREKSELVTAGHVRKASEDKIFRSNLIEEKIREMIRNRVLLIDLTGRKSGQVNGLSVVQLGDYSFGRPMRVTASVGVGAAGIINIERESKLSGRSFDKAMLILEGYLRNQYAGQRPIALSASIAMEQSYGQIEGDSASVAELVCLLSAIAHIPLRQDVAITGSVNQWGQVQAVGGVVQKVEGFFEVCRQAGLSGQQGVFIPDANMRNLVLRPDLIEALRQGKFHIWAIRTVDEGLGLLSGVPTGNTSETGSFHWSVDQHLVRMAEALREQRAVAMERELQPAYYTHENDRDPRPGLPGQE